MAVYVLTLFFVLLYFCYKIIDTSDKKLCEEYNTESNSGDVILYKITTDNYLPY